MYTLTQCHIHVHTHKHTVYTVQGQPFSVDVRPVDRDDMHHFMDDSAGPAGVLCNCECTL